MWFLQRPHHYPPVSGAPVLGTSKEDLNEDGRAGTIPKIKTVENMDMRE